MTPIQIILCCIIGWTANTIYGFVNWSKLNKTQNAGKEVKA